MVVGLGNRDITPDALGPRVVHQLHVSRHIAMQFGRHMVPGGGSCVLSSLAPGVMGQTGMETLEIVRGVTKQTGPDLIMAIDALAARSLKRLNSTIQLTDTGIQPGSGMGNHRAGINEENIGVPVLAIGVPTVIDIKTILRDALEENLDSAEAVEKYLSDYDRQMIVTSTDIDILVKDFSDIIADGINKTLHPGIYS